MEHPVEFLFYALIVTSACAGLLYGWMLWSRRERPREVPFYRRASMVAGKLGVIVQAFVFVALWAPSIGSSQALTVRWVDFAGRVFLLSLFFILFGTGAARKWLLASSIVLFFFSYVMQLTP